MMILTITVVGEQPDIVEDMSALCFAFEEFEEFEEFERFERFERFRVPRSLILALGSLLLVLCSLNCKL
jgi:hypothetical protein